jgi:hypothetical protein
VKIKTKIFKPKKNLQHLNLWISGAIPEQHSWPHPLIDQDIIEFISYLSSMIFQKGGIIIHGSHPLFTPIIVEQAKKFADNKSQLKLFVSEMWGKEEINKHSSYAEITETLSYLNSQDFEDLNARNESLKTLRHEMAKKSNCILSIGGKLHSGSQIIPGVIEELDIAERARIPAYVLAAFGGAAQKVGAKCFKNPFLSANDKKLILASQSINFLPSEIVSLLERDRNKIYLYGIINKLIYNFKSKLSITTK